MEFSPLTGAGALVSVIGCSGSEGRGWQYREPHSGGQIACPRRTSAIRIPMLASPLRRDREDRCDAGAAPATVSGEIAADATEPDGLGKAPRSTSPSQETSSSPVLQPSSAGGEGDAGIIVATPFIGAAARDARAGRRTFRQEPLC